MKNEIEEILDKLNKIEKKIERLEEKIKNVEEKNTIDFSSIPTEAIFLIDLFGQNNKIPISYLEKKMIPKEAINKLIEEKLVKLSDDKRHFYLSKKGRELMEEIKKLTE